jgi:murein DD-endopeptidase MepM/ murein hydrolase activator NlpD
MRIAASLCFAALLTACASSGAPIAYGGGASSAASTSSAPAGEIVSDAAPRRHAPTEAPNWAAGPGTPLSAYALRPEDAQPFDPAHPPRTHTLQAGQSLYDVAVAYQIPLRALIDQNQLSPPYNLRPGQAIALPPPRFHRVAQGESLQDVARLYNVDFRSLALLNRMSAPYAVRVGDAIVLPTTARAWAAAAPPVATGPEIASAPTSGRFAWPLRGRIVSTFGQQSDGRRIDGVEIAADEGARVGAADAGEVVYAGSDLPAYGTLVLVRHSDNYVTAYGFGRRALVHEGERVTRGQALVEVGRMGSSSPKLLFQVRRGAQAIDPMQVLARP